MDTRVCLIGARTHLLISHCFGGYALCVKHSPMVTLVAFQRYLILSSLIVNPLPPLLSLLSVRFVGFTRYALREARVFVTVFTDLTVATIHANEDVSGSICKRDHSHLSILNLPPFTVHRHHSQLSILHSQFNPFPVHPSLFTGIILNSQSSILNLTRSLFTVHCPILPQFQLDRYQSGKYLKIS